MIKQLRKGVNKFLNLKYDNTFWIAYWFLHLFFHVNRRNTEKKNLQCPTTKPH